MADLFAGTLRLLEAQTGRQGCRERQGCQGLTVTRQEFQVHLVLMVAAEGLGCPVHSVHSVHSASSDGQG